MTAETGVLDAFVVAAVIWAIYMLVTGLAEWWR